MPTPILPDKGILGDLSYEVLVNHYIGGYPPLWQNRQSKVWLMNSASDEDEGNKWRQQSRQQGLSWRLSMIMVAMSLGRNEAGYGSLSLYGTIKQPYIQCYEVTE
jgi:hypothetical protein